MPVVIHHDAGEFDGSGSGALNTDATQKKQREVAADRFAVEHLQRDQWPVGEGELLAGSLLWSLTTHPSSLLFVLRLLTVNDWISNTPTSRQLLAECLAKRSP
ncbi:MAG TPA: hypothetical protein VGF88_16775 [Acidobacteriaceae bacterium]|jgi:hypothetical protein